MTQENIGEKENSLLCVTTLTGCCSTFHTLTGLALGQWYFPNGTRVSSSGNQWDFYRDRGQMVVRLNRRRGGVDGIYRCEIPDLMNVTQTIYIGVYTGETGE